MNNLRIIRRILIIVVEVVEATTYFYYGADCYVCCTLLFIFYFEKYIFRLAAVVCWNPKMIKTESNELSFFNNRIFIFLLCFLDPLKISNLNQKHKKTKKNKI